MESPIRAEKASSSSSHQQRQRSAEFAVFNERYIRLLCDFDPHHVRSYIEKLNHGDLKLESVLPALESSGMVDSAVVLMAREGQVGRGIDRLVAHLQTLGSALQSLLERADDAPDSANIAETADDLLSSIDKYAHVGMWLCSRYGAISVNGASTNGDTAAGKKPSTPASDGRGKKPSRSNAMVTRLSTGEELWLKLIDKVVHITRGSSEVLEKPNEREPSKSPTPPSPSQRKPPTGLAIPSLLSKLRAIVQATFTSLLRATTGAPPAPRFLPILRGFLEGASRSSASLAQLREVLAAIFSAYAFEEGILGLANQLLDKDLFVGVEEVSERRRKGWRPLGLACGGCGKKVWGPGAEDLQTAETLVYK